MREGNCLTEAQKAWLFENGYFSYQGVHFKPVRRFTEKDGDFYEVTKRLKRDVNLGMMEADYYGLQKQPYSYKEFYAASTDKTADIFFCFETQKEYVPCTHELQEYVLELQRKTDKGRAR